MIRPRMLIALAVGVVIAGCLYFSRLMLGEQSAGPRHGEVSSLAESEPSDDLGSRIVQLTDQHQRLVADLPPPPLSSEELAKLASDSQPDDQGGAGREAMEWPRGFRRTNFDLPSYFVSRMGVIDYARLVRHVVLNKLDVPVSFQQVSELRALVDHYNQALNPLIKNYRETRDQEMYDLIDAGRVSPYQPPEPSQAQLRWLAGIWANTQEYRDKGMGVEQVLALLEKSDAAKTGFIQESHVVHKGKPYLYRQFGKLSHSDQVLETVHFFALEFFGVISNWFLRHGFASDSEVVAQMARIYEIDGKRLRGSSARSGDK